MAKSVKGFILPVLFLFACFQNLALANTLPERQSPVPQTTNRVPHVQLNVTVDPRIREQLLSRVAQIEGVSIRESIVSLPGAKGFWLDDSVKIKRPGSIVRGREFAHVHPDGSLHASLSPQMAAMAVSQKWATYHPWSNSRDGWQGFVMIYTPQTPTELDLVLNLVLESYRFVTGQKPELSIE